jgi:hypothetical protein
MLRNPAYEGPMGVLTDYEGCDSGINTDPMQQDPRDEKDIFEDYDGPDNPNALERR